MKLKNCLLLLIAVTIIVLSLDTLYAEEIQAVKLTKSIKLDGKLDEKAWLEVSSSLPLVPLNIKDKNTIPKKLQTTFKVLYDNDGVYFGILANEPNIKQIKKNAPKKLNTALWHDDDLEVFIDTNQDRMEYYQFAVNAAGAKCELYFIEAGNTENSGYNPEWKAAGHVGKDFYSVEFFIPYAAFYKQKLLQGKQNWLISVCRQRLAGKEFTHTRHVASRKGGFHDPATMQLLTGIEVPANMISVTAESLKIKTEKINDKYKITAEVNLLPSDQQDHNVILSLSKDKKTVLKTAMVKGNGSAVILPPMEIEDTGRHQLKLIVKDSKTGYLLYSNIFVKNISYQPIEIVMEEPFYRDNIYPTQSIKNIIAQIKLNIPADKLKNRELSLAFTKGNKILFAQKLSLSDIQNIKIPAENLVIGQYDIKINLKDSSGKILLTQQRTITKLPYHPYEEVRIDKNHNLLINGVSIMIRGWYGGAKYMVPGSSLALSRTPRSMNFMGVSKETAMRYGLYYTAGLSHVKGLEKACKNNEKLSDEIKLGVKKIIDSVKNNPNLIGYYLSDEPECRGLSDLTLKELYEFVKKEDPYKMCFIISRTPAKYVDACDIICPHPYNNPSLNEKGERIFGNDYAGTHKKMQEGYEAIKNKAKALWITPQIFSYYGRFGKVPLSVQPDFTQARWSIMSGMANHATGMMPFIYCYYINDIENRISCNYIFETLAWLEGAWLEGSDMQLKLALHKKGAVDVVGKLWKRTSRRDEVCMIATNRSQNSFPVTFTNKALKQFKRIFVVRENRFINIEKDGSFTDKFTKDGVHIYTTIEQLPYFKSLQQIKEEIAAIKAPKGNLLNNGKLNWTNGVAGRNCRKYGDELADNVIDTGGWYPWYGVNRKELILTFPDEVKFSTFAFYSNNIADAELQVWSFGKWITVTEWKDRTTYKSLWKGEVQETVKLRIIVKKMKYGRSSTESCPNITEIEMQ